MTPQSPSSGIRVAEGHASSPHGNLSKLLRVVWWFAWGVLGRFSPRPFHVWRRSLLRLFRARVARGAHVYPSARIWAPWNLNMAPHSCLGDRVDCYTVAPITLQRRAIVSQDAVLCTGTHDYLDRDFPLVTRPIVLEEDCWVAAGAFVGPGVTIGRGAIVGARAVVMKDVSPFTIVAGNPAKVVGSRSMADPVE